VPTPLRLLSLAAQDFGRDRAALARAIAAAEVDVACVHGAPHLLRWRSICAAIGRQSGLVVVTGGRLAGANLLLSSLGIDVAAVRDLTFPGGSPLTPAGVALAALRLRGVDFVLASTTLVGNAAERLAQARQLQTAIDGLVPTAPPAILSTMGSDRPGTAAWQALVEYRVGVAERIFVDGRLDVVGTTALSGSGIVLELELPDAG
jgi:endonuclease/exonuclease/phosphatase family metal-dependent hydrolase